MRNWIRAHRLAVGYIGIGLAFAGVFLFGLEYVPDAFQWLSQHGYEVQAPEWLMLTLALPVVWWTRLHSLTDLPVGQQLLSVLLRSAIVVALTMALLQITHIREESERVATVFVVDVSDSVPQIMLDTARDELQRLWDRRDGSRIRLVTFAEDAREIIVRAGADGILPPIDRHVNGRLGTDLQQAMRLAYGLYPPGYLKRMVLVTDGNETNGFALSEAYTAARLGIRVHHISAPTFEPAKEIMVTAVDVPESLEQNVPFEVTATIRATYEGMVTCTLRIDRASSGETTHVTRVRTATGPVTADFSEIRLKKGGLHRFEVHCVPGSKAPAPNVPAETPEQSSLAAAVGESDAPAVLTSAVADNPLDGDTVDTNNRYVVSRLVPEKHRILYVEGESLYSKNFRDALADEYEVDIRGARGIPKSLSDAQKYRGIIISDVPREGNFNRINMTTRQMKLLDSYAKRGGLLLFTGGQDSLGPGGYGETYLERQVLPVRLDVEHELETPRVAMVLLIDKSASMNGGKKIELAKKAARETVRVLDKRDRLAIVGFDSEPQDIIRLTRASNKTRFDRSIRRLRGSGGTNIFLALERAFEILSSVDAKIKHVILMTDGQSDKQGILRPVQRAVRRGITVSAVALGRQADRNLLYQIANSGKGRFYFTENAEAVPKLFVDETREVAGESVKDEVSRPKLQRKYADLRFLKGINAAKAPALEGWVPTQRKRRSEVIMTIGDGDPLLARWKRGKGWVYVYTSDIKNKWAARWLRWSSFAAFWRQLIKDGIEKEEKETIYPMTVNVGRHELHVVVDAISAEDTFVRGLESTASVTDPDGSKRTLQLEQTAPGRYEARLSARQYGPYQVDISHKRNEKQVAVSHGQTTYAYAEELLTTTPDLSRVQALSFNTGGLIDPSPEEVLNTYGQSIRHESPIWHYFLYAVLVLFLADVLLRRFRFWPTKTIHMTA